MHHLERGLFEPEPERIDPGRAIGLLEAGGELAEAELAAAEVLELLRSGVRGEEIAVVYRSPARAAPLVEHVFGRYGIAVGTEETTGFRRTALGRSLVALARCALLPPAEARPEDLLEYLRAPGLLERPDVADRLEAEVRREGVRTAAEARARLRFGLPEIDALRAAEDPAAELCASARRLLAAPHRNRAPVLDPAEQLDARAVGALVRALAELEELGEKLSGAELIELLETLEVRAGGSAPAARAAGGSAGAVLLTDPLAIRARRFRAVLVCGLQESEFPLAPAPEPFLSDELRRELAICSGLRLRPREDALGRERYLFYTSVSRATERVVLSYRSSDEEGNLALPSPFVADVAELLVEEWPERRRRRMLADVVWPAADAPTERELARSRAAAAAPLAGEVPSPIGSLSDAALHHVRHRRILSAGALESYANCPVRWLIERELQPLALEPDPDPLVRGGYMHTVIEQVLRRLGGPVTRESLPHALDILDEILERQPHAIAPGAGAAVRAAAARGASADLRRYLAHEARDGLDWQPYGLELRFGFDDDDDPDSLPALELGEDVRVRGIVDRVDADDPGPPARRSSATTRAAAPAPSTRARGGGSTASSRSRCTCSSCANCSGSSRSAASTSRSVAAICARGGRSWTVPASEGRSSPTIHATENSSTSCSRTRGRARSRLPSGCARASSSRARRRARATGAGIPGSAVLEVVVEDHAFTDEQLVAIERRDGDLLLDASAGSGKTSVLVERFARSVLEDGIEVSAILTITFTEKAAAEMRDRIRRRLRELGADEAARATEGAFISTIHGFCARVLRGHALAAGLDPAFGVLDAPDAERIADDAFAEALEDLGRTAPAAIDLIASYGAARCAARSCRSTTSCARVASGARGCRRWRRRRSSSRRARSSSEPAPLRLPSWRRYPIRGPRCSRRSPGSSASPR